METLEPEKKKLITIKEDIIRSSTYDVIMHNDDVTTMEFVISVLMSVFFKSEAEAGELMMKVHTEGLATVGTYNSKDVAQSKACKAEAMARANMFPLQLTVEERPVR